MTKHNLVTKLGQLEPREVKDSMDVLVIIKTLWHSQGTTPFFAVAHLRNQKLATSTKISQGLVKVAEE